jgi:hypothetical protein
MEINSKTAIIFQREELKALQAICRSYIAGIDQLKSECNLPEAMFPALKSMQPKQVEEAYDVAQQIVNI